MLSRADRPCAELLERSPSSPRQPHPPCAARALHLLACLPCSSCCIWTHLLSVCINACNIVLHSCLLLCTLRPFLTFFFLRSTTDRPTRHTRLTPASLTMPDQAYGFGPAHAARVPWKGVVRHHRPDDPTGRPTPAGLTKPAPGRGDRRVASTSVSDLPPYRLAALRRGVRRSGMHTHIHTHSLPLRIYRASLPVLNLGSHNV